MAPSSHCRGNMPQRWWGWLQQERPPGCRPEGWLCLQLGLLFLPTSALLAGLSLLAAITIWRPLAQPKPLSHRSSRWFAVLAIALMLGTAAALHPGLAWLGLANWIPFFWLGLTLPPYLSSSASRSRVALWMAIGTVPVIGIGLLQVISGWDQPLEVLGGFIAWTMTAPARATGIFDNANSTAAWLLAVLPFMAQLGMARRPQGLVMAAAQLLTLLLTASRNAVMAAPLVLVLSLRRRPALIVLLITLLYGLAIALKLTLLSSSQALDWLVPDLLTNKLERIVEAGASGGTQEQELRVVLYGLALQQLLQHPWLGIGENGFHSVYTALRDSQGTAVWRESINHSHSLPLEFAVSHGLPALIVLLGLIGAISYRAARSCCDAGWPYADRAWLASGAGLLWMNLWDIPAYDSRINILGWFIVASYLAMGRAANGTAQR